MLRHLALSAALLAAPVALAGPLNRALVDRDASWLVHLDVEAGQKSSLAPFIIKSVDADSLSHLEECKARFGLAPADIKSVTMYGLRFDDDGVAVLTATGAADALIVKLPQAGLDSFKSRVDGPVHYFSFAHEGKTWHCALRPALPSSPPDERLVLVAGSPPSLERGLKVIAGLTANAAFDPAAANPVAMAQPGKGSLIFVAARDLGADKKVQAAMLRNARAIVVDFGETAESPREMFGTLTVTAISPRTATEMRDALQGLIAFGTMMARDAGTQGVVDSLQDLRLTLENEKLTLTAREKSSGVLSKLDQLAGALANGSAPRVRPASNDKPTPTPTPTPTPAPAAPAPK